MVQPREIAARQRIGNPRQARAATHRRIDKKSRARYTNILRVSGVLLVVLVFLMGYVVLTSSLTGLGYAVANAEHQREKLEAQTMRLDDRIAALTSDDRLAAVAARLHMREPQQFAVVTLPHPQVADAAHRSAVFSSLAGLFMPAVSPPR
jgi:hypothetical protein